MARENPEFSLFDVKWRIKNLSFWNPECHGNCLRMPSSPGVGFYLKLFPKGVNGTDERLTVHWVHEHGINGNISIKLTYYGSDKLPFCTDEIVNVPAVAFKPIKLPSGPKFEDVINKNKKYNVKNYSLMLHCILMVNFSHLPRVHLNICSIIDVSKYSVKLTTLNFKKFRLCENNVLFRLKLNKLTCIVFELSFNGINLEESSTVLKLAITSNTEKYYIKCLAELKKEDNNLIKQKEDFQLFCISQDIQSWTLPNFLSRKELLEGVFLLLHFSIARSDLEESSFSSSLDSCLEECPHAFFNDYLYFIQCKFKELNEGEKSKDILSKDFLSVYQDQSFTDFEIRCQEVSFPVHKTVLIARSPVFKKMLSTNLKEVESNVMEISDTDIHTVGRFLTFLYSAELDDLQWESALKLYAMADKYQVPTMKLACSSVLCSSLSVLNVCDILLLADMHLDEKIKDFVHNFIIQNFEDVISSSEWKSFMKKQPLLLGETITFVCNEKFVKKIDDHLLV